MAWVGQTMNYRKGVTQLRCPNCGWRVSRAEWDQIKIDPGCGGCGNPWIFFQDVVPTPPPMT
jgi:predicted RNA-binding Zn-ribbon protein involved in translation (DUF1610 family)